MTYLNFLEFIYSHLHVALALMFFADVFTIRLLAKERAKKEVEKEEKKRKNKQITVNF